MNYRNVTTSLFLLAALHAVPMALAEESTPSEKDREAILAMAGDFRVTFQFDETVALSSDYELKERYHEEATETVKVILDEPERIILQHILQTGESSVIKHWKQEWVYEDQEIYHFTGDNNWVTEKLSPEEVAGTWSQRVSQVDDSPRYESYGKWVHENGYSEWTSKSTRRPLPRREYTKRRDYTVLMAVNRHTITPDGWVHEQDNYKKVDESGPVLCREIGLNVYEKTSDVDFAKANEYWDATAPFWSIVSNEWDEAMSAHDGLHLKSIAGGKPLFRHLFGLAEKSVGEEAKSTEELESAVEEVVSLFVIAPSDES